jgi:glycosyltransferase involved in cell wall biosynthesis
MDGDLQDNPDYISQILNILNNGADMALGVRAEVPFPRSFFSKSFNWLVSLLTGVKIHDINCGLKGFRRNILKGFRLYGQLQRFLPLITLKKGYKIVEFKVEHRERLHGRSKYGLGRIPKAFLDLLGVVLLTDFRARPLHLFGLVGMAIGSVGFFINFYLTILKIQTGNIGDHYTLLLMGVILMILGLQWFSTGLIGEIINKLRHVEPNSD